jgi:hypothetical protein
MDIFAFHLNHQFGIYISQLQPAGIFREGDQAKSSYVLSSPGFPNQSVRRILSRIGKAHRWTSEG